jgi:hypothetical protein
MANRAKYAELIIPVEVEIPRKVIGMYVCSDYLSDGKRHLFLRRPDTSIPVAPKKRAARKQKKAAPTTSGGATSMSAADNG